MNNKDYNKAQHSNSSGGLLNLALGTGIGLFLGATRSSNTSDEIETPEIVFPGYSQYLDALMVTLTEAELIAFSMSLVKITYLRSLYSLDKEYSVMNDRRTRRHLINCASKSLKTPFATKVAVYHITGGLTSSMLLSDGAFSSKLIRVVDAVDGSFLRKGVTDVLTTILSSNPNDTRIDILSGRRVGKHGRFNLSPKNAVFEALAFANKPLLIFSDLRQAMALYYAALYQGLSQQSKDAVSNENFEVRGFVSINYKEDGCGYLTNFHSVFQ